MERYATSIEDGTLYLGSGEDRLAIGSVDDVVEVVGGETYTIEYDADYGRIVDWLDGEDGDPSERAAYFADMMRTIWDRQGNLDDLDDEENPFY